MPGEFSFQTARRYVPQTHRSVPTPTGESQTIRTERYTPDRVRMPGEFGFQTAHRYVPQTHRFVPTPTGESQTIRTERYTHDTPPMPGEQGKLLERFGIIQPYADATCYGKQRTIW